jgi:hypothetical protein
MEPKQGFRFSADAQQHLMTLRLWGRWDVHLAEDYLAQMHHHAARLAHDEVIWNLLLDVAEYVLPPPEVAPMIDEGVHALQIGHIRKQAILVQGVLPHFDSSAHAGHDMLIRSYFQSEEDALQWLTEE